MSTKSTLRLFNAILIPDYPNTNPSHPDRVASILHEGLILSDRIIKSFTDMELTAVLPVIQQELGLSSAKMNASFHKSWEVVRSASIEHLILQQLFHYFTTYGAEALGIYDAKQVYVPIERLDVPDLEVDKFQFTVVHGYTKAELKDKLLVMLNSGMALHDDTITDLVIVAMAVGFTNDDIACVKNKEAIVRLCKYLSLCPKNPIEFLRYLIFLATGRTLIIKDNLTINSIRAATPLADVLNKAVNTYTTAFGYHELASIFLRFKPLFLALKPISPELKHFVNILRRKAVTCHKPMPEDLLNNVTNRLSKKQDIDPMLFLDALDKANIFRKIRLAQALKFRSTLPESVMFKIRNGKSWITEPNYKPYSTMQAYNIFSEVVGSIIHDIKPNVNGKTIYMPKNINYTIPATEKQFTGNIPSGTSVSCDKDMVFGVHWTNQKYEQGTQRIDIDLSLISSSGQKYGWDGRYRDKERTILFSGDVTDAPLPDGATELFYIAHKTPGIYAMYANYFNFGEVHVPIELFVASEDVRVTGMKKNYMVDPNNVLATAKTKLTRMQTLLGLLEVNKETCTFYFCQTDIGNSISVSLTEDSQNTLNYLCNFSKAQLDLRDMLIDAGAKITSNPEDKVDIDFSPRNLEKDAIIQLMV